MAKEAPPPPYEAIFIATAGIEWAWLETKKILKSTRCSNEQAPC